jgi:hypothetical protein
MRIFNCQVFGLESSLIRAGYPMSTKIEDINFNHISGLKNNGLMEYMIDMSPELKRGSKLGNSPSGSGHDCFLKGIIVQCDIEAPSYWWPQAQRYHWFDFVSSQSKMHKILEMNLGEQFVNGNFSSTAYENLKTFIQLYKESKCEFEEVLANAPMGLELTAGITTNYLQLKTMYNQRKNHKLYMWNTVFKQWCEGLPYFKELCLGGGN